MMQRYQTKHSHWQENAVIVIGSVIMLVLVCFAFAHACDVQELVK